MIKVQVQDLSGSSLNYAVAKCEYQSDNGEWSGLYIADYLDWNNAGVIIERESISIFRCEDYDIPDRRGFYTGKKRRVYGAIVNKQLEETIARNSYGDNCGDVLEINVPDVTHGDSYLEAAMRAYVLSKVGTWIDIPDNLTTQK